MSRLNLLSPSFSALAERERKPDENDMNVLLVDSMPVLLAKGSRSGQAKVARELCSRTYNASRDQWYYGIKINTIGQKRRDSLPFPKLIFVSDASCHDLPLAKQALENRSFPNFLLAADKAYADAYWGNSLAKEGIKLLTPSKLKRGQTLSFPGKDVRDTSICRLRQPIEGFFNWLQHRTYIQFASKVRSLKGLLLHVFGRISAALLAFNSCFA